MAMDPQQRLALEVSYEAMQQTSSVVEASSNTTGIFVAECSHDFATISAFQVAEQAAVGPYTATG
eukprot:2890207-Rhodomonas_salina.1